MEMTGGHKWVSSQLYSQSVNFKRRGRDAAPKSTRLNRAMLELPRLKIGEQSPRPDTRSNRRYEEKHTIYLQWSVTVLMCNHLVSTYQPYQYRTQAGDKDKSRTHLISAMTIPASTHRERQTTVPHILKMTGSACH